MWLGCCGVSNLQVPLETRQSAWLKWHVEEHALDEILDEIFWVLTMFLFTFHTMSVANTGNFLEVGSFWLGSGSRRGQQLIERQKERGRVSRDTHSMEIPELQPNHQPSQTTIVYSSLSLFSPAKVTELLPQAEKASGSSSRGFFDRLQRQVDKTLQKAGWQRWTLTWPKNMANLVGTSPDYLVPCRIFGVSMGFMFDDIGITCPISWNHSDFCRTEVVPSFLRDLFHSTIPQSHGRGQCSHGH